MKRIITYISCLFIFATAASAQDNVGFLFLPKLQQQTMVNPAWNPIDSGVFISLPTVQFGLDHTGPTLDDVSRRQVGSKRLLNLGELADAMENDMETISIDMMLQSLMVGYAKGDWFFQLGNTLRTQSDLTYSRDLAAVLWKGNGPLIGETLTLDSEVDLINFVELFVTVNRQVGPVRLGASIKSLSGVNYLRTESSRMRLTTRETDFALEFDNDYSLINSSVLDYNGITDLSWEGSFLDLQRIFNGNQGWAFDLGATMQFGERTHVGVSLLDLGGITWDKNTERLTSRVNRAYEGIRLDDLLDIEDINLIRIDDSVEQVLNIQQEDLEGFRTDLPMRLVVHGQVGLTPALTVGGAVQMIDRSLRDDVRADVWVNYQPASWVVLGLSSSYRYENFANIGFHTRMFLGPMSIFFQTHHVNSIFAIDKANQFSIMSGLNLRF